MQFIDYYAVLGVTKTASDAEIASAYRQLARKYHPDVSKAKDAEERFKQINEAYEVLKDPAKRSRFDRYGAAWKDAEQHGAPPPGFDGFRTGRGGGGRGDESFQFEFGEGGDFSDFFQQLFGFGGAAQGGTARPRRGGGGHRAARSGADQEAHITLSLEEAAGGGRREISLRDPRSGRARTLAVTIPRGVRPGSRIRLAGQGDPGDGGGAAGHLYLEVDITPHPLFRLEDDDLHTVLPVSPWTAALGGEVLLRTLDGSVKLKIPRGSSSGRKIRLKGHGFPKARGANGDLYAEVRIVIPADLSPEEQRLFEQLGATSSFVPPEQHA